MRSYTISIPLNESYTLANAGRSTTFTLTGGGGGGGDIPAGYKLLESMVFKNTDNTYWNLSAITDLNSTDKYSLGMFLNHSSQGATTESEVFEAKRVSGTNGGIYI